MSTYRSYLAYLSKSVIILGPHIFIVPTVLIITLLLSPRGEGEISKGKEILAPESRSE